MDKLDKIDRELLETIRKHPDGITAYELKKKSKYSWSTITIHCMKLKSFDLLNCEKVPFRFSHKNVWTKNQK